MRVALRCPVRGCGELLARDDARWVCPRAHSFDQHRRGFLTLLQPQDRRSANPGDSKHAALARRRLAEAGYAEHLHLALAKIIRDRLPSRPATLLDVGCGEGSFLRSLADQQALELHGVDISLPSIDLAARAQPEAFLIVANADRPLPFAARSFDFVTSIDSRVNASEFDRLLNADGLVLIAVPGPDDLAELRERIQGARIEKTRAQRVEAELASALAVVERATVRQVRVFEADGLRDLLAATYRGFRQSEQDAVAALGRMSVTLSHDLIALKRR